MFSSRSQGQALHPPHRRNHLHRLRSHRLQGRRLVALASHRLGVSQQLLGTALPDRNQSGLSSAPPSLPQR